MYRCTTSVNVPAKTITEQCPIPAKQNICLAPSLVIRLAAKYFITDAWLTNMLITSAQHIT